MAWTETVVEVAEILQHSRKDEIHHWITLWLSETQTGLSDIRPDLDIFLPWSVPWPLPPKCCTYESSRQLMSFNSTRRLVHFCQVVQTCYWQFLWPYLPTHLVQMLLNRLCWTIRVIFVLETISRILSWPLDCTFQTTLIRNFTSLVSKPGLAYWF